MKLKCSTFLLALLLAAAAPAWASAVLIGNASFETPVTFPGGFAFPAGGPSFAWSCTATCIVFQPSPGANSESYNALSPVPDGIQALALGLAGGGLNSAATQTLTTALAANTEYTLTFYVGNAGVAGGEAYSGYAASVSAGGVTLGSDINQVSPAFDKWVQDTLTFSTGANPAQLGQDLVITLGNNDTVGAVAFDLVQLDATATQGSTAPEPGAWMMAAAGLGLLGVAKRKLRK